MRADMKGDAYEELLENAQNTKSVTVQHFIPRSLSHAIVSVPARPEVVRPAAM